MGRRILSLIDADPELEIVGALEREGAEVLGEDVGSLIGRERVGIKVSADRDEVLSVGARSPRPRRGNPAPTLVFIDFTHPSATEGHVRAALKWGTGLVIGTTGLSEKILLAIRRASRHIPILQAPNMSAGVNFLFGLVILAAKTLGPAYDIEITETHHRMKKDAPSGTALELARLLAKAKGWDPSKTFCFGRHGETGVRKPEAIGIHARRGGDVVGEHTVSFLGDGETLELTHRAMSRDAFARGALVAAKFVAARKSGLYDMRDVLGI